MSDRMALGPVALDPLSIAAFVALMAAFAATQETDGSFALIMRLVVMPLFLFSGAFFPISQLPGWLQAFAVLSPLYHGVELCRSATTGQFDATADVIHLAVLVGVIFVSAQLGIRSFTRKLAA